MSSSNNPPHQFESIDKIVYERSKWWGDFLKDLESKSKNEIESNSILVKDFDKLFEKEDEPEDCDARNLDFENEAQELEISEDEELLRDITNQNNDFNELKVVLRNKPLTMITRGDISFCLDAESADILNQTRPMLEEHERRFREAGLEKILQTFDPIKIEKEVGGWLRQNETNTTLIKDEPDKPSTPQFPRRYHNHTETDSDSEDTARYVLSIKKRQNVYIKSGSRSTIKTFCTVKSKRDELHRKYACASEQYEEPEIVHELFRTNHHHYVKKTIPFSEYCVENSKQMKDATLSANSYGIKKRYRRKKLWRRHYDMHLSYSSEDEGEITPAYPTHNGYLTKVVSQNGCISASRRHCRPRGYKNHSYSSSSSNSFICTHSIKRKKIKSRKIIYNEDVRTASHRRPYKREFKCSCTNKKNLSDDVVYISDSSIEDGDNFVEGGTKKELTHKANEKMLKKLDLTSQRRELLGHQSFKSTSKQVEIETPFIKKTNSKPQNKSKNSNEDEEILAEGCPKKVLAKEIEIIQMQLELVSPQKSELICCDSLKMTPTHSEVETPSINKNNEKSQIKTENEGNPNITHSAKITKPFNFIETSSRKEITCISQSEECAKRKSLQESLKSNQNHFEDTKTLRKTEFSLRIPKILKQIKINVNSEEASSKDTENDVQCDTSNNVNRNSSLETFKSLDSIAELGKHNNKPKEFSKSAQDVMLLETNKPMQRIMPLESNNLQINEAGLKNVDGNNPPKLENKSPEKLFKERLRTGIRSKDKNYKDLADFSIATERDNIEKDLAENTEKKSAKKKKNRKNQDTVGKIKSKNGKSSSETKTKIEVKRIPKYKKNTKITFSDADAGKKHETCSDESFQINLQRAIEESKKSCDQLKLNEEKQSELSTTLHSEVKTNLKNSNEKAQSSSDTPEKHSNEVVTSTAETVAVNHESTNNALDCSNDLVELEKTLKPQPRSIKMRKLQKLLINTNSPRGVSSNSNIEPAYNSTAYADDTATRRELFAADTSSNCNGDGVSNSTNRKPVGFVNKLSLTASKGAIKKNSERTPAKAEKKDDVDCTIVSSTTSSYAKSLNNSDDTSKGILLYTPKDKTLDSASQITITEEHLNNALGMEHSRKFLKRYIGQRCFSSNSTIYYQPPSDTSILYETTDSDSDDDILEKIGLTCYGKLYSIEE